MNSPRRSGIRLCRLDEIADPGSRGFSVVIRGHAESIFLIRKGEAVFGYRNRCPHAGSPLDWMPDQFLNLDKDYIQCATHAALFRIEDGRCVAGPCRGDVLNALPLAVDKGEIFLDAEVGGYG
jgi:nitrite reductase/ring-hydroxylating ferredoxin subunit